MEIYKEKNKERVVQKERDRMWWDGEVGKHKMKGG